MTPSRLLYGIGVSSGVATGPAVVLRRELPDVPARVVPPDAVEAEVGRLYEAVRVVRAGLEMLRARARERVGPEEAKIFDAQILMLEDQELLGAAEKLIRENQLTAERAFEFTALEVRALWANSGSSLLRDKLADLSGVLLRVLYQLLGRPDDEQVPGVGRPAVVVTRELTPGLTLQFEREHVVGFVSEEGTRTAHAAILARSLGIPCIMGLSGALEEIPPNAELVIDGTRGTVLVSPSPEEIDEAQSVETRRHELAEELERSLDLPAVTADGVPLTLRGNLDLPEELDLLARNGAEGIGLLRTEFLVVGRATLPDEEEQLEYFRRVARRLSGQPVTVRSYDVGGDKFPAAFRIPAEPNPFLGWRALRVCLDRPEVFIPQLRALLRARLDGDIRLMLPLVIDLEEVTRTRELITQVRGALRKDGVRHADDLPLGVMVETPAAVALADQLVAQCDFVSVGTNDLTQYTLAIDRGNARLAHRFTGFHPAVLRLLAQLADAARKSGTPFSVCGEMASEPLGAFLLLGLGYRELSVAPTALPVVRWLIRRLRVADAEGPARAALDATGPAEALEVLESGLAGSVDLELFDAGWLPRHRSATSLQRHRTSRSR
jgi:phosphotransferase system enzyme I (PtsI)